MLHSSCFSALTSVSPINSILMTSDLYWNGYIEVTWDIGHGVSFVRNCWRLSLYVRYQSFSSSFSSSLISHFYSYTIVIFLPQPYVMVICHCHWTQTAVPVKCFFFVLLFEFKFSDSLSHVTPKTSETHHRNSKPLASFHFCYLWHNPLTIP